MIMKSHISNYIFILFLFPFALHINSQQIDPRILENLSEEEINLAMELYSQDQDASYDEKLDDQELEESLEPIDDMLNKELTNNGPQKFGYNFFSSMPTSISAMGDLPLPNDYKISIKDQFSVILSGTKERIFDLSVRLDGTILFPEIGSISVVGETFGEVKEKISNIVKQTFIGVDVNLSLKSLSAKKITIVGAVNMPGSYLVNPFSTITGALAYSGGILEIASLREIKLIRANGDIHYFDLYDLLIYGDRSKDLTIDAGDTILINPAKQFVTLNGSVRRPGIYEIIDNEDLSDLLEYGLGFNTNANKSKILIRKTNENFSKNIEIETADLSLNLKDVFSVDIFSYLAQNQNNLYVSGAVYQAGSYNQKNFSNLEQLISAMTFVDVYPWLAFLEKYNDKNYSKEIILFNLNDPNTYKNVSLEGKSEVHFFNFNNIDYSFASSQTQKKIDEHNLKINYGDEQFLYPVVGKFKPISLLNFIGLNSKDYISEVSYIKPIENNVLVSNIEDLSVNATKFNTLQLKKPIDSIIEVLVEGEVNYPGKYSLRSGSSISDLYELVGGFKEEAFFEGIIFLRADVRNRQIEALERSLNELNEMYMLTELDSETSNEINLATNLAQNIEDENLGRVAGDFSPRSKLTSEMLLANNDTIIIPKSSNIISVVGEVLNPTSFVGTNYSVIDVVNMGGGFKDTADKNNTYIISANGTIRKASRNLFSGNSKVLPGDTVVVPRRISQSGVEILAPITQILSNLAFSAAAIDNLKSD